MPTQRRDEFLVGELKLPKLTHSDSFHFETWLTGIYYWAI